MPEEHLDGAVINRALAHLGAITACFLPGTLRAAFAQNVMSLFPTMEGDVHAPPRPACPAALGSLAFLFLDVSPALAPATGWDCEHPSP